jgi:hypothetical protein
MWEIEFRSLQAILICAVLLWLQSVIRSYWRLRHFKGPVSGAFSKLWMIESTYHGRMHLDVADVCKKYGTSRSVSTNAVGDRSNMKAASS